MKVTHVLAISVTSPSGRIYPVGTPVELRASCRLGGRETVLLRVSDYWPKGGEFVTDWKPGMLTPIK